MIAIFWDRKNRQEVSNTQLMKINLVHSYVVVDNEGFTPGTPIKELTDKYGEEHLLIGEEQLGTLGYKSKNCRSYVNWDLWLNESDLVFLRMENE